MFSSSACLSKYHHQFEEYIFLLGSFFSFASGISPKQLISQLIYLFSFNYFFSSPFAINCSLIISLKWSELPFFMIYYLQLFFPPSALLIYLFIISIKVTNIHYFQECLFLVYEQIFLASFYLKPIFI